MTPCYRIVSGHLNTFIQDREGEGRPLPEYVLEEFDAYLKCGIPAHGFLRLKCRSCGEEKIVAFSCKKRGFCPSCCGKRMAEAAAHLCDNVLPFIPYRQFVISFPIPLRYWLFFNKKLFSKIHGIIIRQLHGYFVSNAESAGLKDPSPGSISFRQNWGSALNLNPHLHILCPDGVYTMVDKKPIFRKVSAITDKEVQVLITGIGQKIMGLLRKSGYLDKDGEIVLNPVADDIFQDHESLTQASTCSIGGRIAFGPNAGKYVTRIGSGFGYGEEIPLAKGRRCFSINGFSMHANTSINTLNRGGLEKLIRYIARGPLSNERLTITKDDKVKLSLKTPWSDGTSHLLFTPSEFLEKLTALIPLPRSHLVRWAGVFAPNSPYRKLITIKPEKKKGFQFNDGDDESRPIRNSSWSKMLAKVFKIDVSKCQTCGGEMEAICSVTDSQSVEKYLKHIGWEYEPPARAPPKTSQPKLDFD